MRELPIDPTTGRFDADDLRPGALRATVLAGLRGAWNLGTITVEPAGTRDLGTRYAPRGDRRRHVRIDRGREVEARLRLAARGQRSLGFVDPDTTASVWMWPNAYEWVDPAGAKIETLVTPYVEPR